MKPLVYIISTILILTGMYGGIAGARDHDKDASTNVRKPINLSPAYYHFYGNLRAINEPVVNRIRPGFRWDCSIEQAFAFDGEPQPSPKQFYEMSTYSDQNGYKWRMDLLFGNDSAGIVVDVGQYGTEFKDIYLNVDIPEGEKQQIKSAMAFVGEWIAPTIGAEFRQGDVIRYSPNAVKHFLNAAFGANSSNLISLGNSSYTSVVLGETTIDGNRNLVLGIALNLDARNISLVGYKAALKGELVGYQLIDLISGVPVDSVIYMDGFVSIKSQNLKAKVEGEEKRLCRKVTPSTSSSSNSDAALELEYWNVVKMSNDVDLLQAYLDEYPNGKFAPLAKIKIKKLNSSSGDN